MANRIKSISKYSGTVWGTETPIGADAANVDLATSYSATTATDANNATVETAMAAIQTDTTNLKKAGHGNGTVTNYDSTSGETSKVLTTDCVVAASDDTATAWSKFNRFRRRVSNKFADYFLTSNLKTAVSTTGATSTVYTTSAINQYLANVVGYTDATAPEAGTIASQLSLLNDNFSFERVEGASNISRHNCSGGTISIYDCVWEINQTHTLFHFMCRIGLWDITRTGGNPGVKMTFPFSSYFTKDMEFKGIGRYGAGNATQYEQANSNFNRSDGYFYLQTTETTANVPTSGSIFFSCNAWYNLNINN